MPPRFWQGLSGVLSVIVLALLVVIVYYDRARQIGADLLVLGARVAGFLRRRAVKNQLETQLEACAHQLNADVKGLIPSSVCVAWVKRSDKDAFVRGGEVVLRLGFEENPDRQLATATMRFVSVGLLPHAKPYVDTKVMQSSELTVARRLLSSNNFYGAFRCFVEEVWRPTVESDEELKAICEILTEVDNDGLFVPIFLREMGELSVKAAGASPTKYHHMDTRDFVEFMHRIATQEPGSTWFPLDHRGRFIKVAVLLVASRDKYLVEGLGPYMRRLTSAFENGMERVYLCARGNNIEIAEYLRNEAVRERVAECVDSLRLKSVLRDGRLMNRVCIVLRPGPRIIQRSRS